jgi:hypothetical protein
MLPALSAPLASGFGLEAPTQTIRRVHFRIAAGVTYTSGIILHTVVNRSFGWSLGFLNPQWALTPKTQIPIELHFDGGPAFNLLGSALLPSLVECRCSIILS